jgi:hypothetical protein
MSPLAPSLRKLMYVVGPSTSAREVALELVLELADSVQVVECERIAARSLGAAGRQIVICVDDPARRPSEREGDALGRWIAFVDEALAHSSEDERVVIVRDDAIVDPQGQLARLAERFGCRRRIVGPPAAPVVRVTHSAGVHAAAIPLGIEITYEALRAASELGRLERAQSLARRARSEYEATRTIEDEAHRLRGEVKRQASHLRGERDRLERQIDALREAVAAVREGTEPEPASLHVGSATRRADYEQLVHRLKETVEAVVPAGARVAVVSRGDPELLRFERRDGCHFPQAETGVYAGHHPSDSVEAIASLDRLRRNGVEYLAFPSTARWWLEHYSEFKQHLDLQHELLVDVPATGVVYRLRQPAAAVAASVEGRQLPGRGAAARQLRELVTDLLPDDVGIAVLTDGSAEPWLDDVPTFDLAIDSDSPAPMSDEGEERAIVELEAFRAHGAVFLVVPFALSELLQSRRSLVRHIETRYRLVTRQRQVCAIYDLSGGRPARHAGGGYQETGFVVG